MLSVTLISGTGLVQLVKLMKPLEKFSISGFGSKAFINFPLCYVGLEVKPTLK